MIPENLKHLFNQDDIVYEVPGDGSCGPSSAAAHLFQDEIFGAKLRREMNKFVVKHWEIRYKYITKCSKETPFVRQLGYGKIVHTDPKKLLKYLSESEEAAFMWTDSEDLAIIADMYRVKIKIVTTKGLSDKNPTVNWILPEKDLEKEAKLQGVKIDDIILIHENDSHVARLSLSRVRQSGPSVAK